MVQTLLSKKLKVFLIVIKSVLYVCQQLMLTCFLSVIIRCKVDFKVIKSDSKLIQRI